MHLNPVEKFFIACANAFPIWMVGGAGLALWAPETATWFQADWIPAFLGIIMLSMGLTLDFQDFMRVLKIPRMILLGMGLQYFLMPSLGYGLARWMELPIDYVVGLVLVASCPGGTASNVVCFIARSNVALSVSLTTVSTLMAVVMTPLLTTLLVSSISTELLGSPLEVDTLGLLLDTFTVVILPVAIGVLLNHLFHNWIKRINTYAPFLAVLSIMFIVDYILAVKKNSILESGSSLLSAVVLLHALGFLMGYLLSKLMGFMENDARTASVEVGMQNSGLATELARHNFSDFGLATVPGAVSALTHCLLGSLVAGICRFYPVDGTRNKRD